LLFEWRIKVQRDKQPWLFIYFRDRIRVIQSEKNKELWLCEIGTGNGIVRKFSKTSIDMWDGHYIALEHGFWWSGLLLPGGDNAEKVLTFSPKKSSDVIFCIPEEYIIRVYDMANHTHVFQRLLPNPPK
jgi:hypothetical protein